MPVASVLRVGARVLVIDNYDSFVYNLVQYLGELGAEPMVYRHDAVDLAAIAAGGGIGYVDAPISGGQAGAENGALTVMVGGNQAVFDRAAARGTGRPIRPDIYQESVLGSSWQYSFGTAGRSGVRRCCRRGKD